MNGSPSFLPAKARVLEARRETSDVVTLTLEPETKTPQRFSPGQFNMLYAFGVGEVAISMSGDPARRDVLVHTIKAVGAVSEALCRAKPGSVIGVRGPYGTAWPVGVAEGSDLLVVAGGLGLAPLRPVIYHALERRHAYGRLSILVGGRTPEDLPFRRELEALSQREGIETLVTVDRAPTGYRGRVGVVTALLSEIRSVAPATAFVCGPELMMRAAVRELARHGLSDDRIYLSLERNMKCAMGLCGRCQYGASFVCKDGPVFRYDRIRPLFSSKEI